MGVVFILGAGASVDAGVPAMGKFLEKSRDLYVREEIEEPKVRESFERIFEFVSRVQQIHAKGYIDHRNLESILAALDMGKTLNWIPDYSEEQIDELIRDISVVISLTIERSLIFPLTSTGTIECPKPYLDFVNLLYGLRNHWSPKHDVSVITFNYDVACDRSLIAGRLNPDYCLNGREDDEGTPLLKLHGSLNWIRCEQCNTVHVVKVNKPAEHCFKDNKIPRGIYKATMPTSRWLNEYEDCKVPPPRKPFIIPPTWNKTGQHQLITPVWRTAAKVLSGAEYIFVIGYSFPESDAFFHYLYAVGTLGKTVLRRFMLFDPDPKVENRFKNLLGRASGDVFQYKQVFFKEAIGHIRSELSDQI
jgi:hypothetical protein